MSEMTLEARVAALEEAVERLTRAANSPQPKPCWQLDGPPPDLEAFDRMVAYGQYFRRTGRDAPPDWNPGDPIPEPDWTE